MLGIERYTDISHIITRRGRLEYLLPRFSRRSLAISCELIMRAARVKNLANIRSPDSENTSVSKGP